MKEIDSILYIMTAILAVDETTTKEVDFLKHTIFERLEKVDSHMKVDMNKIAIYMKHNIPEMIKDVLEHYGKPVAADRFVLPETIKNKCKMHIENLKECGFPKNEIKAIIQETIMADSHVSPQEAVLSDFLYGEIDRVFG